MTKTQLENLFFNENLNVINPILGQSETFCIPLDQRIYVLEDVDCQNDIVMERSLKINKPTLDKSDDESMDKEPTKKYEDSNKVDLSFLLNLLDGVLENPGRIVIMTSNHPDILDRALIRPGRIDVIAKFRNCSNTTVKDMIEFFYDTKLPEDDIERIYMLQEGIITPAELSKVMFENFTDVQATIAHIEQLSETSCKTEGKQNRKARDVLLELLALRKIGSVGHIDCAVFESDVESHRSPDKRIPGVGINRGDQILVLVMASNL